jgi:hypothetical protein
MLGECNERGLVRVCCDEEEPHGLSPFESRLDLLDSSELAAHGARV